MNPKYLLTAIVIFMMPKFIMAQTAQKPYSIFSPVPKEKLREMETDRPDVTESAITVDAGHFQYESDLFALERERSESSSQKTVTINRANLKMGLTGSISLQVGIETYTWQKERNNETGEIENSKGFGDINLRLKQNLIGNDKGNFSMALLPYVTLPTATFGNSKLEEGLIVPMQVKLPSDWKVGTQVELDHLKDNSGDQKHVEYLQSLTVSHEIRKTVTGIAETYFTYDFKQHHYSNFFNAAVQVEIAHDVKIDGGVNYGIQKDAMKKYFLGIAVRI
ncbi:transporter [Pedobacter suwonensis]|uniref:transporter n=1 Tax=Pedobacter suwonensis TaxID=332999 RepID=UPI0011A68597|nr:transporter [Pedobacter suwonensis]